MSNFEKRNLRSGHLLRPGHVNFRVIGSSFFFRNVSNFWLNSYCKFGGATRRRFLAICEKPYWGVEITPPPRRAPVRGLTFKDEKNVSIAPSVLIPRDLLLVCIIFANEKGQSYVNNAFLCLSVIPRLIRRAPRHVQLTVSALSTNQSWEQSLSTASDRTSSAVVFLSNTCRGSEKSSCVSESSWGAAAAWSRRSWPGRRPIDVLRPPSIAQRG